MLDMTINFSLYLQIKISFCSSIVNRNYFFVTTIFNFLINLILSDNPLMLDDSFKQS